MKELPKVEVTGKGLKVFMPAKGIICILSAKDSKNSQKSFYLSFTNTGRPVKIQNLTEGFIIPWSSLPPALQQWQEEKKNKEGVLVPTNIDGIYRLGI